MMRLLRRWGIHWLSRDQVFKFLQIKTRVCEILEMVRVAVRMRRARPPLKVLALPSLVLLRASFILT